MKAYCCTECGSDRVFADAWVPLNYGGEPLTFDAQHCENCEDECHTDECEVAECDDCCAVWDVDFLEGKTSSNPIGFCPACGGICRTKEN